ncbi:MAG TPA: MmcQ/YjbR family DNA-binding protein [Allosphingosinicella sp.]|nr:MmcQ/YjbR family DNA-binding protein [Allosphingosinicella sp.]
MTAADAFEALRAHGLAFPEATEDFPWGHCALKVRGKTFAWLDKDKEEGTLGLTVKLPVSRDFALVFDFAEPAGYGLGRSGWISCRFPPDEEPDLDLLGRWIAESYRAVAPKKLAALIPEAPLQP